MKCIKTRLAAGYTCNLSVSDTKGQDEHVSAVQVEPVKWSPERMRKVLNNAILTGNVGDDMIACAEQALGEGFEGSLSRYSRTTPHELSCCVAHCCRYLVLHHPQ